MATRRTRSAGTSSAIAGAAQSSDANMKRMRQFLTTLFVVWTAACIATYIYSQQQNIPSWIALAVLPAFLVELAFYLVIGFASVRKAFDKLGSKPLRAALLAASAVIPYLLESTVTGTFQISSFLLLLAMASAASTCRSSSGGRLRCLRSERFWDSYGWLLCPRNSSSADFCNDCSRVAFTVKSWD